MSLTRRQLLVRGGALAGALALPSTPAFGATNLRKMIDIGPGGVIHPGSAQDYRAFSNRTYFADTQTGWIRMWADWPTLQPDARYRIDDPASPGYANLLALDDQIRQACADGLRVMLLPYRHPLWANGTATLVRNSDAEISFESADRMTAAVWNKYVAKGRNPAVYNPSRRALEYRVPPEGYPLDGTWSRFFEFLMRRYHYGQRASGRFVHGFELVNEPNLQLFPQRARSTTGDPFALSPLAIGGDGGAADEDRAGGVGARGAHDRDVRAVGVGLRDRVADRHALHGVHDQRARRVRRDRLHAALGAGVVAPQLLRRRGAGHHAGPAAARPAARSLDGEGRGGRADGLDHRGRRAARRR